MTELRWRRTLSAPAAVAWDHLTVPEKMSAWSKAPIARVDEGDGGRPDGVGALRKVTVRALGRRTTFEEVVVTSAAPNRFVYHVSRGLPVRDHEGVIVLRDTGSTCELDWHVRFEPVAAPLGAAAARLLDAQMSASLDELERVVANAGALGLGPRSFGPAFVDDEAAVGELSAAGEAILATQRELADSLRGDPKYWFSRVYEYVTEQQLRFVREGATHRAWVLRLLPVFHRFYVDNLTAHRAGRRPELPWRTAFRVMDGARDGNAVVRGLLLGVRAHIEEDLPRALAEVWLDHYRGRCDFVRLRADYLRMGDVFRTASSRLVAEMPKEWVPMHLRLLGAVAPAEVQDWGFSRYYDVDRARRKAFERGRGLARWLDARA